MLAIDWPLFSIVVIGCYVLYKYRKTIRVTSIWYPFVIDEATKKSHYRSSFLFAVCSILLIGGGMRLQKIDETVSIKQNYRDLILAIDASDSMRVRDMEINNQLFSRYDAVKYYMDKFIDKRQGDRLGFVIFGSKAYIQAPLTADLSVIKTYLEESYIGIAGPKTAIGDALALAVKQKDKDDTNQAIILITDGSNTSGTIDPYQAVAIAKKKKIKIYTIAIGNRRFSRDIDFRFLQTAAASTNGKHFYASNANELASIYAQLDRLEQNIEQSSTFSKYFELYYWFVLAFIIVFIVGYMFTPSRRVRKHI